MNCPNCSVGMTTMKLDARMGDTVDIDVCAACQAFWFDRYESLKLSAASTLKLMKFIGENNSSSAKPSSMNALRCPRCTEPLAATNDMQRSTRFTYWRCLNDHGRFIRFFEFLREKDFIRPLSAEQIQELKQNIQTLNCSNCGAPIDLMKTTSCTHCGSALSMLDMQRPKQMLADLAQTAESPVDPNLSVKLAEARLEAERSLAAYERDPDWWTSASSSGLVNAGLNAVARWLTTFGH